MKLQIVTGTFSAGVGTGAGETITRENLQGGAQQIGDEENGWHLHEFTLVGQAGSCENRVDRDYEIDISFEDGCTTQEPGAGGGAFETFKGGTVPCVMVAPSGLDLIAGANHRLEVTAQNVSTSGFVLRVRTWSDTKIWSIRVNWLAHGYVQ